MAFDYVIWLYHFLSVCHVIWLLKKTWSFVHLLCWAIIWCSIQLGHSLHGGSGGAFGVKKYMTPKHQKNGRSSREYGPNTHWQQSSTRNLRQSKWQLCWWLLQLAIIEREINVVHKGLKHSQNRSPTQCLSEKHTINLRVSTFLYAMGNTLRSQSPLRPPHIKTVPTV